MASARSGYAVIITASKTGLGLSRAQKTARTHAPLVAQLPPDVCSAETAPHLPPSFVDSGIHRAAGRHARAGPSFNSDSHCARYTSHAPAAPAISRRPRPLRSGRPPLRDARGPRPGCSASGPSCLATRLPATKTTYREELAYIAHQTASQTNPAGRLRFRSMQGRRASSTRPPGRSVPEASRLRKLSNAKLLVVFGTVSLV
ncbi:ACL049Wp [Eremothecium gossypii ATCC 10895]|uniref:ACL049Wp n=1 Tax=Eremothecium gossypii (strain ATCC 10895 / CBS 109.51 / FGSC 9923 / NRRL Y-1056) TaxID=284811 RepID=Q75CG8_EREGS|nr:ACL049Wp [Eremothecium gossypii ATCC 10895]AAS51179.1 ACL049Wp [Eremothecium gossypii ATCC 10895]AEY95470.1 FACL049Wp [Eremothecium gossypii FDAG1]